MKQVKNKNKLNETKTVRSAKLSDCEMAAMCYCSLSVIVFKEHQSHRTLPCFDL